MTLRALLFIALAAPLIVSADKNQCKPKRLSPRKPNVLDELCAASNFSNSGIELSRTRGSRKTCIYFEELNRVVQNEVTVCDDTISYSLECVGEFHVVEKKDTCGCPRYVVEGSADYNGAHALYSSVTDCPEDLPEYVVSIACDVNKTVGTYVEFQTFPTCGTLDEIYQNYGLSVSFCDVKRCFEEIQPDA